MDDKQKQQHRQHFNLSEPTKQMLDELTAKRYPGRQRRQSQLVEDLITEAFAKERNMSTVTTGMYDPGPGGLAPTTAEAIGLAKQEAIRMSAAKVYPEHLLLGVIAQGGSRVAKLLCMYGMDMQAIRVRATEVFSDHYTSLANDEVAWSSDARVCISRSTWFAKSGHASKVLPEHLVLSVLAHVSMEPFIAPLLSSIDTLKMHLRQEMETMPATDLPRQESSTEDQEDLWEMDPWSVLEQRYAPDQIITRVITKVASFGLFVRVDEGIEGLVRLSEIPPEVNIKHLHEGMGLRVRILHIDRQRRRIALSLMHKAETSPITTLKQELASQAISSTRFCPSCKSEVQSNWQHCVYCGALLAKGCSKCGAPRPAVAGARFCFECGSELE